MKFLKLVSVLLVALTVGCLKLNGSGGGGSPPITEPATSLKGTYHLKSFEVIYQSGFHFDQSDFPHWAGTMKISDNTVTTMYDLDGEISESVGLYTIQYEDQSHDSGVILLSDGSSADFGCEGLDVEIFFESSDSQGLYLETDVWRKVSNSF